LLHRCYPIDERFWQNASGPRERGMSAFKGMVASTDHFDLTFQAAADTNGVAIAIRRASVSKKQSAGALSSVLPYYDGVALCA